MNRTWPGLGFSLLMIVACSGGRDLGIGMGSLETSKVFTPADLGAPEGGLMDPKAQLLPMLREDGDLLVAETTEAAQAVTNVAASEMVDLAPGTRVAIVARNGDWMRILAKVVGKDGKEVLIEGFVKASGLKFLGLESEGLTVDLASTDAAPAPAASADVDAELSSGQGSAPGGTGDGTSDIVADISSGDDLAAGGSCSSVVFRSERERKQQFACSAGGDDAAELMVSQDGADKGGDRKAPVVAGRDSDLKSLSKAGRRKPKLCVVPGELLRRRDLRHYFEVTAVASKIRVEPSASGFSCNNAAKLRCQAHYASIYKTKDITVSPTDTVHRLSLEHVLAADNQIAGGMRSFKFSTLDGSGNITGSCTLRMRAASPIVLDLAGHGRFEGVNLGSSKVRFDVLGTGNKVQTGWIARGMGLLALDRNGDGSISSGLELFGEGTARPDGSKYSNGYEALAAADDNRDGLIDGRDPVFRRLLVWQDVNQDGQSSRDELQPLTSLGITALSVQYGPSFRHGVPGVGENDARYEARYFGPKHCGPEGCLSFDVFFATAASLASR